MLLTVHIDFKFSLEITVINGSLTLFVPDTRCFHLIGITLVLDWNPHFGEIIDITVSPENSLVL